LLLAAVSTTWTTSKAATSIPVDELGGPPWGLGPGGHQHRSSVPINPARLPAMWVSASPLFISSLSCCEQRPTSTKPPSHAPACSCRCQLPVPLRRPRPSPGPGAARGQQLLSDVEERRAPGRRTALLRCAVCPCPISPIGD
jgi:hypothetical protein